jgi:hypothetical protein
MRRRRPTRLPAALAAAVLLIVGLAACDDDGAADEVTADDPTGPTAVDTGATTAPEASDGATGDGADTTVALPCEPELPAEPSVGTPVGEVALLTDLVVEQTTCRATVTFSFGAEDDAAPDLLVPGFTVEGVQPPFAQDGSGEPVEVDGDTFVLVRLEPASVVDLSGDEVVETYTGPDELRPTSEGPIVEVQLLGSFEAVTTWVIGLRGEWGVRAVLGLDPPRVVVTIA